MNYESEDFRFNPHVERPLKCECVNSQYTDKYSAEQVFAFVH